MAKQERLLDLSDPVQAFAHELRRLRRKTGDPPLEALGRAMACSHPTVSAYLNGYRLPSSDRLMAFLDFCKVPTGDRARWGDRLDRSRRAATRHNTLMLRDDDYWRDLDPSQEKNVLTEDQVKLMMPNNSVEEIVDAIRCLLSEGRGASALMVIEVAISTAPARVAIGALGAMGQPRDGFYAEEILSTAGIRWKSPSALFELIEALHGMDGSASQFKMLHEAISANPSKKTVAGLLNLLRKSGQRSDISQIIAIAVNDHRPQEIGELLKALHEAGQKNDATILMARLCEQRSVYFIRKMVGSLRDTGQEDAAASLLEMARSALTV